MHRIKCSEVWGGIRNRDEDVCSAGLTASLYSQACDGGKGGDIYYLSVCGGDMLTRIAIADVVGHGRAVSNVSEWLYKTMVQHMGDADGAIILADLNQIASEKGLSAMTTVAVAAYYLGDGKGYFSYAGHHPILIWRRAENKWLPARLKETDGKNANLPLGVVESATYEQNSTNLSPGDRMFLYTDGVIEAPDHSGELFGETRLLGCLQDAAQGTVAELKTSVLSAVKRHTGGALGHDDVTVLALEIN